MRNRLSCRNKNSFEPRTTPYVKKHWIDCAAERFDSDFVKGVKDVLNVGILFITYPVFYALFEQLVRIILRICHIWYILCILQFKVTPRAIAQFCRGMGGSFFVESNKFRIKSISTHSAPDWYLYFSFHKQGISLDFSSKQDEWTFGRLEGDFTRPNAGKNL